MKKLISAVIIVVMLAAAFGTISVFMSGMAYADSDAMAAAADPDVVEANNGFSLAIFNELMKNDTGKNIFISPFSISAALSMTYNGANAETADAMARTLGYSEMDLAKVNEGYRNLIGSLENADSSIKLSIANSVWISNIIAPRADFIQRLVQFFGAEAFTRNFADTALPNEINGWISRETNGKITKMIDSVDNGIVMFLINAIYFKGDWLEKFDRADTREADFHLESGATTRVNMMYDMKDNASYYKGNDFAAVRLPYGRDKIAMYVFLPDEGTSLDSFVGSLDSEKLGNYIDGFRQTKVQVELPRFKIEYGKQRLNDALKNLGMGVAFDPYADFSGIAPNLYIGFVDHKAVIETNEEGSEAAAVTVVGVAMSAMPQFQTFTADRPFFFIIRDDRSGSILFMGTLVQPEKI